MSRPATSRAPTEPHLGPLQRRQASCHRRPASRPSPHPLPAAIRRNRPGVQRKHAGPRKYETTRLQDRQAGAIDPPDWSRSVAQPGSAHRSGRWGRRFESCHSDQISCSRSIRCSTAPGGRRRSSCSGRSPASGRAQATRCLSAAGMIELDGRLSFRRCGPSRAVSTSGRSVQNIATERVMPSPLSSATMASSTSSSVIRAVIISDIFSRPSCHIFR